MNYYVLILIFGLVASIVLMWVLYVVHKDRKLHQRRLRDRYNKSKRL